MTKRQKIITIAAVGALLIIVIYLIFTQKRVEREPTVPLAPLTEEEEQKILGKLTEPVAELPQNEEITLEELSTPTPELSEEEKQRILEELSR